MPLMLHGHSCPLLILMVAITHCHDLASYRTIKEQVDKHATKAHTMLEKIQGGACYWHKQCLKGLRRNGSQMNDCQHPEKLVNYLSNLQKSI